MFKNIIVSSRYYFEISDTYTLFGLLAVGFFGFFELAASPIILFLVSAHFIEELRQDLSLLDIQRLVFIRVCAESTTLLTLAFFLSFLGRHIKFKFI